MTLGEVTTAAPCMIPPTETAIEALGLMQDSGFRHVPVVDLGHLLPPWSRPSGSYIVRAGDDGRCWCLG
jgi:CBS domain-containing protein